MTKKHTNISINAAIQACNAQNIKIKRYTGEKQFRVIIILYLFISNIVAQYFPVKLSYLIYEWKTLHDHIQLNKVK